MEEEERVQVKPIAIGDDLSLLSIDELSDRIVACQNEIVRIEKMLSEKQNSHAAADAFFKKK